MSGRFNMVMRDERYRHETHSSSPAIRRTLPIQKRSHTMSVDDQECKYANSRSLPDGAQH